MASSGSKGPDHVKISDLQTVVVQSYSDQTAQPVMDIGLQDGQPTPVIRDDLLHENGLNLHAAGFSQYVGPTGRRIQSNPLMEEKADIEIEGGREEKIVLGISTYDYIIALRDQEQQATRVQQSPQMSPASSLTGLSSASSFNTFHQGAWCTPPRLFLEDQFDVVPPGASMSMNSSGKRTILDMPTRKRNTEAVKISPWTLAHLNAEEVSKVAAQARKKSRVHHPLLRQEAPLGLETDSSFGSSSRMLQRPDNRRRANKRGSRLLTGLPLEPPAKMSAKRTVSSASDLAVETSSMGLAPLQLEARSAFCTSLDMSSAGGVASSPDSSLDSPDVHPFHVSVKAQGTLPPMGSQVGIQLSRSTSDGYEASGGEDSDRVPSRMANNRQSSLNWSTLLLFSSGHVPREAKSKALSSSMDGRPIRH